MVRGAEDCVPNLLPGRLGSENCQRSVLSVVKRAKLRRMRCSRACPKSMLLESVDGTIIGYVSGDQGKVIGKSSCGYDDVKRSLPNRTTFPPQFCPNQSSPLSNGGV